MVLLNYILDFEPKPSRFLVGVSGGLDSVVLLDVLATHFPEVERVVLHVNHQLQPQADEWAKFVEVLAIEYNCAFKSYTVDPVAFTGQNIEAKARQVRYDFFKEQLCHETDYVLLAHHQQDQIETFFLNLQRGSGLTGLAAIPLTRPLGAGYLARPLLQCSRGDLEAYAQAKKLKWIEDPSNQDISLSRNFLRHEIMPRLTERWPHFVTQTAAAIQHVQTACQLLDAYVQADLEQLGHPLDLTVLHTLPKLRWPLLIQSWVKQHSGKILNEKQLTIIMNEVVGARPDANPLFAISGLKIYRIKQQLVLE